MTIRWGIVGLGHWAIEAVAPAIIKAADTELVSVCRRIVESIKEFISEHDGIRAYDSLEKMLEDPELDVVYVCTPHGLHYLHTIQAAEAGKHVMCEKPMALTVADAEGMIEACKKNKVKLGVPRQRSYAPAHREARRYIQSGSAGEIHVDK